MRNPIAISLSPNTEADDVLLAIKSLLMPWRWKNGHSVRALEEWFREQFHTDAAYSFNAGRSALLALLKSFGIGKGDEVIVQAFTCVAVPEVILWAGARPVYCDIDASYNIDPPHLEKLITKKTKAIIVQHTFGIPAKIREIREIAHKSNSILIEDCAHSLGATVDGKLVGSFGDAAFFSFGRDKVLSSVYGGVAILNQKIKRSKDQKINKSLQDFRRVTDYPSGAWIFQQLLHPILFQVFILPFYNIFGLGKMLLVMLQKIRVLSLAVYPGERQGLQPSVFPRKMPNALAVLAFNQLAKLRRYNNRRREIARRYGKPSESEGKTEGNAVYLRYPVIVDNPVSIIHAARKEGILLGNWYHNVIDPDGVDFPAIHYRKGSCPNAEEYASKIINLPTYPTMTNDEVRRIVMVMQSLHQ